MEDLAAILGKLRMAAGLPEDRPERKECEGKPQTAAFSGVESPHEERDPSEVADPQFVTLVRQVADWAGSDRARWKRLHVALLRIYAPVWDRIDARDILMAWVAARLALVKAREGLARLDSLGLRLTRGERAAKGGRQADVSFWGRLAPRLETQIPAALSQDPEATALLASLLMSVSTKTADT